MHTGALAIIRSGRRKKAAQAIAQMSQTKICVRRDFVAEFMWNRSG
jgi:hypothetical protein